MIENLPVALKDEVIVEHVDDELLLFEPASEIACRLNRTAFTIWQHCDGTRSLAGLASVLSEEIGELADEDLVRVTLDSLDEHGLILSGYTRQEGEAARLSRRRFIHRAGAVGVAAAALPVVQAIVAPSTAAAQSTDY